MSFWCIGDSPPKGRIQEKLCSTRIRIKAACRRWKPQILCVVIGLAAYVAAAKMARSEAGIEGGYLERGDYGAEPVVYELVVDGLEESLDCQMEIDARQYDESTAETVFDSVIVLLPNLILGDNESLDEVRMDLNLVDEFEEYGVQARWFSSAPEVLNSFGEIILEECPEEGIPVQLTVELAAGTYMRESTISVRVCPEILTEEEQLQKEIEELLLAAERKLPEQKEVFLPTEYRGKKLQFRHKQDKDYCLFPLLGVLLAVLLYAKEKKDVEAARKARSQKLLLGYADVVYQLMVFTGAGLTVVRAWEQIVKNYERRRSAGQCELHPAYEEMAAAYGRIQCGTAEGKAIDEFGRSCNLQQYLKLSTLLNQNRKTGTKNLQAILEQEMVEAWEQQKNAARRMGEEAGTKLLAPLFLMLIVVMVVIMVPAMLSMG